MRNILLENYLENEFEKDFPDWLSPYKEKIKNSIRPTIKVSPRSGVTTLWDSKFGGNPYMPIDFEYPCNLEGRPLQLLAQLNFEQIPHIEPFPKKGILQFYIDVYDDLLGLNFNNQVDKNKYRVIYHEEVEEDISKLVQNFDFVVRDEENYSPLHRCYSLEFQIEFEPVSFSDYTFYSVIGEKIEEEFEEDNEKVNFFSSDGSRIGGYPYFTQNDPRSFGNYQECNYLLFQMDTLWSQNNQIEIMWGDSGVGNFLINYDDLKNKNFEHVLYNWDCC